MADRHKILIADDVEFFLKLEQSFLQREDITVLVARNGKQAFDLVSQNRPDVVFLDMYMPEMDGDECCRMIKDDQELRRIPVVMVTATDNEKTLEKCRKSGCDEIMHKPFQRQVFMDLARKYLNLVERAEPRSEAKVRVQYGNPPQKDFSDYTVNLSTGGLFLETDNPLAQNETLTLTFHLSGQEQPICCDGRVAWINAPHAPHNPSLPAGMGIQFINLSLEQMHQIRTFLQQKDEDA
ncbi:MAG: hypothetical protein C0618_01680 [Desulfuromonas sp.]|nr:MAG: hypothetical protein C0618_01680 [Desulfuromonas sp.]